MLWRTTGIDHQFARFYPGIAAEWHPRKNGDLRPDGVVSGSEQRAWWLCPVGPDHEWQATVAGRTIEGHGCPRCNTGWTLGSIRAFVSSICEHLQTFTPAELYLLFQQNGLLRSGGKGRSFVNALATGRFPIEELTKFVEGTPSLVDQFVQDPAKTLEALETAASGTGRDALSLGAGSEVVQDGIEDPADAFVDDSVIEVDSELPLIETKDVLRSLGLHVVTSADQDAVEFLLASAAAKLWKHSYHDEIAAVGQAEAFVGDGYAGRVKAEFLQEFRAAKELKIPEGYAFTVDGAPAQPNLMQRHVAAEVRDRRRVGNWSGTGAGKTLSAVLASRVIGAGLTVICCPNSVVEDWKSVILEIFPDSAVATKTFRPIWSAVLGGVNPMGNAGKERRFRYLVLNFEAFQQPDSGQRVRSLIEQEPIDFVIVDEIHYAKQRNERTMSRRRQLVTALTSLAGGRNPDLHVLGMSATPVINNLQEGKSMVELVTGVTHDELDTRPTVPNCMTLYQRLVTLGSRWIPEYDLSYEQIEVPVDCAEFVDEIRALGRKGTPLQLEQILTRARLPVIREQIRPKTLIYTHYVEGIDRLLRDAIQQDGWKVGFYTGDDHAGRDGFLKGDVDVLIGSSAIGTGVDGLQRVCNRLIVNVLPWTAAELEQLKGRVYRQGQRRDNVTLVIPLTYAQVNGERWSWCESKMRRLQFKKSIADAAVDGVVPEGHLRTPEQAYRDLIAWLERLETDQVEIGARPTVSVSVPQNDSEVARPRRRYAEFSQMNRSWNQRRGEDTHRRLLAEPEEWAEYHALYREARRDWAVVPYEEMIRWCEKRSGYVIGDFGCGEAKLAEAVSNRHTVHSFDHVAASDVVAACDMAHVPLDDNTLDAAVFSLSLMGANFADYIREAHRTLKLDGQLHIIEATSRFADRTNFADGLKRLGFAGIELEDLWKFTHILARKTERRSEDDFELRF